MAEGQHADPHVLEHAAHFESFEKQNHAAMLGMWVFLASEVLLFSAMFALYASYRVHFSEGFSEGIAHNLRWAGSLNTLVLLLSSWMVARSIPAARSGERRVAFRLIIGTIVLGLVFMGIKAYEYGQHFHEGIFPGGRTEFFAAQTVSGLPMFFNIYYMMTGAHALHVLVGLAVLTWLALRVRGALDVRPTAYPLELGAMYWHLVDIVWIFLGPLFYLTGGGLR